MHSLADMGVDFSDTGQASSGSRATFNALSTAQISDACTFLNSSTNGIGGYSSALSHPEAILSTGSFKAGIVGASTDGYAAARSDEHS